MNTAISRAVVVPSVKLRPTVADRLHRFLPVIQYPYRSRASYTANSGLSAKVLDGDQPLNATSLTTFLSCTDEAAFPEALSEVQTLLELKKKSDEDIASEVKALLGSISSSVLDVRVIAGFIDACHKSGRHNIPVYLDTLSESVMCREKTIGDLLWAARWTDATMLYLDVRMGYSSKAEKVIGLLSSRFRPFDLPIHPKSSLFPLTRVEPPSVLWPSAMGVGLAIRACVKHMREHWKINQVYDWYMSKFSPPTISNDPRTSFRALTTGKESEPLVYTPTSFPSSMRWSATDFLERPIMHLDPYVFSAFVTGYTRARDHKVAADLAWTVLKDMKDAGIDITPKQYGKVLACYIDHDQWPKARNILDGMEAGYAVPFNDPSAPNQRFLWEGRMPNSTNVTFNLVLNACIKRHNIGAARDIERRLYQWGYGTTKPRTRRMDGLLQDLRKLSKALPGTPLKHPSPSPSPSPSISPAAIQVPPLEPHSSHSRSLETETAT